MNDKFNDSKWRRSLLEEIELTEGVYDQGIFKAVFTAGGPGSGKSFTASELFGIPTTMPFVSADGLKGVNSDSTLETYLKKAGLGADMEKMGPADYAKAQELRATAKNVTAKRMVTYINGKLGMLIDGTGKNFAKVEKKQKLLKSIGYDCYMVFVNTSLEVALERNKKRARVVPEDIVKSSWKEVQNNLGKFQSLFGRSNLLVVDNSTYEKFPDEVVSAANAFVRKPIKNHIAKSWIKKELEIRKK
tara:strand:- start:1122 stop:1859 length:738 start_codon:yes stop_codon:yes gene_type:complete